MEKCKYCNFGEDYAGDSFDMWKNISPPQQYIDIYLVDNVDAGSTTLSIEGTHIDIEIKIKYCPFCGRQL